MIKTKKIKEYVEKTETLDIICNNCGKTCSNMVRFYNAKKPGNDFSGLLEQEVHGGYDSKFIGDMISWKFSICEECLSKIVKNFKIPHEIKSEISGRDYVTLKKHDSLEKKWNLASRKEWISAISKLYKILGEKFDKQSLIKKSQKDNRFLYNLYHQLQDEIRKKNSK